MQSSDLMKMKQGQVVYNDLKRQLGDDPCNMTQSEIASAGIYYKSYELREMIREGLKGCLCEGGQVPCGAPLPHMPTGIAEPIVPE